MSESIEELRSIVIAKAASAATSERNEETQREIGALLALLPLLNRESDRTTIEAIGVAMTGLLIDKPYVTTSRTIRSELVYQLRPRRHPIRYRILGGSSSLLVSLGLLTVLVAVFVTIYPNHAAYASAWKYLGLDEHERLLTLVGMSGAIGGIVSLLLRIQTFAERMDNDGWGGDGWALYLTGLSKPLVGMFCGWFVYALHQAGIIPLSIKPGSETYWFGVLAFLSGFSERLFTDIGTAAEKHFQGTPKDV